MVQAVQDPVKLKTRRTQWITRVDTLVSQIAKWSAAENWSVDKSEKAMHESLWGDYIVPTLRIRLPGGEVHVNPVGLHVVGADGRVDLETFPTLNRVRLVGHKNQWEIYTDSNVPLRKPWNRKTFSQLALDLVA